MLGPEPQLLKRSERASPAPRMIPRRGVIPGLH